MAKEKLNITLDGSIKSELQVIAAERHMTVSALITYWALKNRGEKEIQMTAREYEVLMLKFKWMAEKVEPCYKEEVEELIRQYRKEYEQYIITW